MREQATTLQYKFSFDNGSRSNHQLIIVNSSNEPQLLSSIAFACNTNITQAWEPLGTQWSSVTQQQDITNNTYIYSAQNLPAKILLNPGENLILEYSVAKALGPDTNVGMPPKAVYINGTQITNFYTQNPQQNPNPTTHLREYHANWGQYQYQRTMNDEVWSKINALTYAFIGFDTNGNVFALDTWADQFELPLLNIQKKNRPYLNTSISFGGWTNAGHRMDTVFSAMAANPQARQNFVKNAVSAALQVGVNGIDIDWEYVTSQDAANFVLLLQELRTEMQNRGIQHPQLTITAPASQANISVLSQTQWQTIANTVDSIGVMAYDYFGGFSATADFHSAMKLSKNSPNYNTGFCVTDTMACYKNMEINPQKLELGIPNYSRAVIVQNLGNFGGLYQPVIGTPPGDFNDGSGIYGWDTICRFLENPNDPTNPLYKLGVKQWNHYGPDHPFCQDAQMSLLSGQLPDGTCVVINFLDQRCATLRGQYIKDQNLGGGMVWANYTEPTDPTKTITAAISDGFASLGNILERVATALSAFFRPLRSTKPTRTLSMDYSHLHDNAQPSAPPFEENPAPDYQKTMHVNYTRNNNKKECMLTFSIDEFYQQSIHKASQKHAAELKDKIGGAEKGKLLHAFGEISDNATAMQNFMDVNRKTLNQHRNVLKRAAISLFGEKAHRLFAPPKSMQYAKILQEQCANRENLMR